MIEITQWTVITRFMMWPAFSFQTSMPVYMLLIPGTKTKLFQHAIVTHPCRCLANGIPETFLTTNRFVLFAFALFIFSHATLSIEQVA